ALAALAAIFMAAPAVAADLAPPPPAPAWTGFHIGVGGGGMFAFVHAKDEANVNINNNFFVNLTKSDDLGDAALFGTVEAGFDWQVDSFVIGVLANYDFGKASMDSKTTASDTFFDNNNNRFSDSATFKDQWKVGDTWAIGARAGFLAMDNALLYVMGGYTQADVRQKLSLEDNNNSNIEFHKSTGGWQDGWFVG